MHEEALELYMWGNDGGVIEQLTGNKDMLELAGIEIK